MAVPSSFNLRAGGTQAITATVVLLICFAAWCVQLGGVASLQAACPSDLHLPLNDVDPLVEFLQQQRASAGSLVAAQKNLQTAINQMTNGNLTAAQIGALQAQVVPQLMGFTNQLMTTLPQLLSGMSTLTARSTSGVFTLTPDIHCDDYYRYQWLNTALQFVVLVLALVALSTRLLVTARVAICSLLTVASVMAIENAHTFYYVREFAPDLSLLRGKVFFVGCIITASSNLLLLFVLGVHDEVAELREPVNVTDSKGTDTSHDGDTHARAKVYEAPAAAV